MKKFIQLASSVGFMAFFYTSSFANTIPPSLAAETAIVAKLHFVSQMEISIGTQAATLAEHSPAKEFAAMMVADHQAADEQLLQLATQLDIPIVAYVPQSPPEKQEFVIIQSATTRLLNLSAHSFDLAYLQDMIFAHIQAINDVNRAFKTPIRSELSALLQELLPILQKHKAAAQEALIKEQRL